MDDLLTVETRVGGVGGAAVVLLQQVVLGQTLLVQAQVKVAAVAKGRAQRLASPLRGRLLALAAAHLPGQPSVG